MNTLSIRLRARCRKLGLHRLAYRIESKLKRNMRYEESFSAALQNAVHPGDVVWDVGANVGDYTELFSGWVGPKGHVVAFEPNPEPLAEIERRIPGCAWLSLVNVALGSSERTCSFIVQNGYSRSAHLQFESQIDASDMSVITVQVSTGDAVCARMGQTPNVIKIDVEGFEDDVLNGLERTLSSPLLRAVLLEVHFQALEDRGRPTAPIYIEKLLKGKGFRLKWVDKNHLQAERRPRV